MVGNSEWTTELSRRWDQEIVRYPDPAVEVLDPRFLAYRIGNTAIERLFTGTRWAEGPVWFGDFRSLVFSDIPNNRMLRYCELTGEVTLFRQPANFSNGNTRDLQGRLITCEHLSRRITRTDHDGSQTVLLDRFDGKRLNAPMTWLFIPTALYGSQIPAMESWWDTRESGPRPSCLREFTGWMPSPGRPPWWPTTWLCPTGCAFLRTSRCSTSQTAASLTTPTRPAYPGLRCSGWQETAWRPHLR